MKKRGQDNRMGETCLRHFLAAFPELPNTIL